METHYGYMENYGDYESPFWGCERTACGCTGEKACENTTDEWDYVTCKNCLKVKNKVIRQHEEDEKHIVAEMGAMVEFFNKEKNL